jgi:hypothetical protein
VPRARSSSTLPYQQGRLGWTMPFVQQLQQKLPLLLLGKAQASSSALFNWGRLYTHLH